MHYSIIGSGNIGTAIARCFAQTGIDVGIANTRGPESVASLRAELGANIVPQSIEEACAAETIFLGVPFPAHATVAARIGNWNGKIIVDATNAFKVAPGTLGDRLSSEVVAAAFAEARVVKAFNHLAAAQLGTKASANKQVIFIASDDDGASAQIADLATRLGFAPVNVGRLTEGGVPLHVRGGVPGGLLLQNLVKVA